jgi:putative FmdB family regulatory protein
MRTVPIYEYQCRKCEEITERLEVRHEAPLRKCPKCGGRVEKRMSAGAFAFKGSGFYATDYAGKGNGKSGGSDAPACPAGGGEASPSCAGCPKAK